MVEALDHVDENNNYLHASVVVDRKKEKMNCPRNEAGQTGNSGLNNSLVTLIDTG